MTVEQVVVDIIAETLSISKEEIKMEEKLSDSLGVDSTEMVNIILSLEKKLETHIDEKKITKNSSPLDIVKFIESQRETANHANYRS